jgi:pyruvate formate lyase activating enzyme
MLTEVVDHPLVVLEPARGSTIAAPHRSPACAATRDGSVGWVRSWDLANGTDGPGRRLVIHVASCPGQCPDCQSDVWQRGGSMTSLDDVCQLIDDRAIECGSGTRRFTASGREPLAQPAFTRRMLEAAKTAGLDTALDTSGFLGWHADDALLDATDLVVLDLRASTEAVHRYLTGRPLAPTLDFARRLAERGQRTWLRYVLVPGYTDQVDEVETLISIVSELDNVQWVEVVPHHALAAHQQERFRTPFLLRDVPRAIPELVESVRCWLTHAGIRVR